MQSSLLPLAVRRLHVAPSQHCAAIALPSAAVVALGSCTHAFPAEPPSRTSTPCAGKITGANGGEGGDGGGGGGGGDGGGDGGAEAQITKPPIAVSLSLSHLIVSPAAITTLLGPLVPEYSVPPMVM